MCDDDDDDVSAVIRAERVIITEEGEEVTGESQDTQAEEEEEEEEVGERGEEAGRQKGQEKKKEEEREEKEEEGEKETEEEQEEVNVTDDENHVETSTEAGEVTKPEEGEANTDASPSNQDSSVKIITHADEETSANTDTDADTEPVEDSVTKSALNADLSPDADPAAATAHDDAETHPQHLSETPGGAVQTPSVSNAVPDSALSPNGAQKSPGPDTSQTNAAAQFQEIALDGGVVEEEPLLAAKVEPLTDTSTPNQAEGAKTKTCQCCSVM